MFKRRHINRADGPLMYEDHKPPMTRREFLARGFMSGAGLFAGGSLLNILSHSTPAHAALSNELQGLLDTCGFSQELKPKIPFICFDLAGGANIAGSNVLVGQRGGQKDFISTQGYSRLGLPGDMIPSITNPDTNTNTFIDERLGLAFHSDSSFLRGMVARMSPETMANVNGAIIPSRSDNDTGNNPHNPMYGIAKAGEGSVGAAGELLTLIGSVNSDSGGNSLAPDRYMDVNLRPTKVDRPSDVTGLVDTGKLVGLLNQSDAVAVLEAIYGISASKIGRMSTGVTNENEIKERINCTYIRAADLVDRFGDPTTLNPTIDPNIVGSIFTADEVNNNNNFRKTASVMKLVINGLAGAGTIQMGGYDYHTGDRAVGEIRDFNAGQCMGACLEYAALVGKPLMLYVFSDGSVFSNGMIDDSEDGRGKGVWTGDSSASAANFFLVYNPTGRPTLLGGNEEEQARHQQLGFFRSDGSVETAATPAANNVNLLVNTVILNYMALHDELALFDTLFSGHGLGSNLESLTAFQPIVNKYLG